MINKARGQITKVRPSRIRSRKRPEELTDYDVFAIKYYDLQKEIGYSERPLPTYEEFKLNFDDIKDRNPDLKKSEIIDELVDHAVPYGKKGLKELQQFAKDRWNLDYTLTELANNRKLVEQLTDKYNDELKEIGAGNSKERAQQISLYMFGSK